MLRAMTNTLKTANAAIYYQPEGFDTSREKLMGRHAAGEGFLKGFVEHAAADTLYCYAKSTEIVQHFSEATARFGNQRPVRWLNENAPAGLAEVGALHLPDPSLSLQAWRRRSGDQRAYSITGLTHTTASAGAMEWMTGLLTAPVQDWDALICTSNVVKDTVEFVLESQAYYFAERLGATRFPRPQLPVIPLGADTDALAPSPSSRGAWRQKLEIGPEDIAVLFVGRLSFHAKAHPLPMYLGLEQAAKASGKKIHLIQSGWFANDFIEKAFKSGARTFCPSVNCIFLDGRQRQVRAGVWQAADIFTSLSDNIQETFGLTPIEAMAAGLPSVVTDWNGYKDTVRDGIDGIRIPTLMPPAGWCTDLADRHAAGLDTYDLYCGFTSQFVAVEPAACAKAYLSLIESPDLRARFGAAARQRAREVFDWRVVVGQYQALWADLAERRAASGELAVRRGDQPGNPARADPFLAFASYPTETLSDDHLIEAMPGATPQIFDTIYKSPMISFVRPVVPSQNDCHRLLVELARGGRQRIGDLAAAWPAEKRFFLQRSLIWLAKLGLARIRKP